MLENGEDFVREPFNPADTQLIALIRDHANQYYGTNRAFAEAIGVREHVFSLWMRGMMNPLAPPYGEALASKLERPIESLRDLGRISVEESSDIVGKYLKQKKTQKK